MDINFDLEDIRAFLAVFQKGSFIKAGRVLNVSQPALSRRIKAIETKVGAQLFERTTRRVTPTAVGKHMQPTFLRILDQLETSIQVVAGTGDARAGQLTLACGPTAARCFLPRFIRRFNERYPLIRVRVLDSLAGQGQQSVVDGEAEFGINMLGFSNPDLVFTSLMTEPLMAVCHRDHPLARKRAVRWSELTNLQLIGFSKDSGIRVILDEALAPKKLKLRWAIEVNLLPASLELVKAGIGISVLPRMAMRADKDSKIKFIPVKDPVVRRAVGIIERRAARLSPVATHFRELLLKARKTH